jgi:hypothetical protein
MGAVSDAGRDEFEPSSTTRNVLAWAQSGGASTIGDALDMLDLLEHSNDVPEVLGESGELDEVRAELELGIELAGADQGIDDVL